MTRNSASPLLLLAALGSSVLFAQDKPEPRQSPPPRIVLPPDEMVPLKIFRVQEAKFVDWSVASLKAPDAWAKTKGKGVKVAVLDTGCDVNHPDLRDRVADPEDVKDFSGSRYGAMDRVGHGTHCAGSVLANGTSQGCAPEASLIVGKVLGDSGSGGVDDIRDGIKWAVSRNADVISMSLGGAGQDSYIPPALKEAVAAGVIVVAAAGNEGPGQNTVGYPGGYAECIAVAAADVSFKIANFSSRGAAVFVTGPGVQVRSTYPGGQYATMSGTSMATPNIAGVAALWIAAHPEVAKKDRPAEFRKALIASTKDIAPPGRDTASGYGFPDAMKLVEGGSTPPPPSPSRIVFTIDELFTPAGRAKLFSVDPSRVDRLELVLKP